MKSMAVSRLLGVVVIVLVLHPVAVCGGADEADGLRAGRHAYLAPRDGVSTRWGGRHPNLANPTAHLTQSLLATTSLCKPFPLAKQCPVVSPLFVPAPVPRGLLLASGASGGADRHRFFPLQELQSPSSLSDTLLDMGVAIHWPLLSATTLRETAQLENVTSVMDSLRLLASSSDELAERVRDEGSSKGFGRKSPMRCVRDLSWLKWFTSPEALRQANIDTPHVQTGNGEGELKVRFYRTEMLSPPVAVVHTQSAANKDDILTYLADASWPAAAAKKQHKAKDVLHVAEGKTDIVGATGASIDGQGASHPPSDGPVVVNNLQELSSSVRTILVESSGAASSLAVYAEGVAKCCVACDSPTLIILLSKSTNVTADEEDFKDRRVTISDVTPGSTREGNLERRSYVPWTFPPFSPRGSMTAPETYLDCFSGLCQTTSFIKTGFPAYGGRQVGEAAQAAEGFMERVRMAAFGLESLLEKVQEVGDVPLLNMDILFDFQPAPVDKRNGTWHQDRSQLNAWRLLTMAQCVDAYVNRTLGKPNPFVSEPKVRALVQKADQLKSLHEKANSKRTSSTTPTREEVVGGGQKISNRTTPGDGNGISSIGDAFDKDYLQTESEIAPSATVANNQPVSFAEIDQGSFYTTPLRGKPVIQTLQKFFEEVPIWKGFLVLVVLMLWGWEQLNLPGPKKTRVV